MRPRLYMTEMSPPSRANMLVVRALDIEVEYVNMNFMEKDHLKPDYVKINPQHTVPTLQDGDYAVWDSHAITIYLCEEYGKHDNVLYPKDNKARATILQRMFFDTEMYLLLKKAVTPLWAGTCDYVPSNVKTEIDGVFSTIETFLNRDKWIAGSHMTIADFTLIATVSSIHEFVKISEEKFPRIIAWIKELEKLPYYEEANGVGARALGELIRTKIKCCK